MRTRTTPHRPGPRTWVISPTTVQPIRWVVDTPGEEVQEYRLRPEGGGAESEWAAAADGSTLTPAAS
jgi:hypothetical protein